jgi:hypothetical protein
MKRARFFSLSLCFVTPYLLSQSNPIPLMNQRERIASQISASQGAPKTQASALDSYGKLPLTFEPNHGQTDARVKFLSRTGAYSIFLTANEAVLTLPGKRISKNSLQGVKPASLATRNVTPAAIRFPETTAMDVPATESETGAVLRMWLRNANPAAKVTGIEELAGRTNYFIGNDPAKWQTNVPTYAKVKYEGIYSGIDLVYYGNQRQLEYDFIVAPHADPRRVSFDMRGAKMRQDERGDLIFKIGEEEIRWHKPVAYQGKNGARTLVAAHYVVTDQNRVGFELAKYDANRPLYIDPLIYSTYLGGSVPETGNAIAVDSAGNAYVTGLTESIDFPVTAGAFQPSSPDGQFTGNAFVTKINPTGSALVYSTYLGGNNYDTGAGIAVDSSGNAYVTGATNSSDFPVTLGAFQTVSNACGDACAFVSKLNPTGSALVYSTYLGGSGGASAAAIALDSTRHAYVTGTAGGGLPTTSGAFQPASGGYLGSFVSKFNLRGSALIYSTYVTGTPLGLPADSAHGIAVDSLGHAYITGHANSSNFPVTPNAFQSGPQGFLGDAFVTQVNATGRTLVYSTYLGGNNDDFGTGIAVDRAGIAYVTGCTYSTNFPTTPGAFQTASGGGNGQSPCLDSFVTAMNTSGSALVYSSYLGGELQEYGAGIVVDGSSNAYISGYTSSPNFPIVHALQPVQGGPPFTLNAFVTKINPTGSALVYSTYLGGNNYDTGAGIAVDSSGNAYVTGFAFSANFPTMNALKPFPGGGDAFVAKITAEPSDISLFPLHLDFGGLLIGGAGSPQVSAVNNASSDTLTISSISITGANSGDFAQTNNCGTAVPAGTSCSITVTFTPTTTGHRSAAVTVASGAPAQAVSLTGVGLVSTATTLTSSPNPSKVGEPVTFTAVVTSSKGPPPDGETVSFFRGVKSPRLLGFGSLHGGTASFTTSRLKAATISVKAVYGGDSEFGGSTSKPVKQVVTP